VPTTLHAIRALFSPCGVCIVFLWCRRVLGAPPGSLLALGDASLCLGPDGPLPQTAQVAAQQGAYAARLLNRRYDLSADGAPTNRQAAQGDAQAWLRLRGAVDARPFDFLNLGLLAYLGGGEAISQVQVGERRLLSEAGSTGFLLWRSVYVVKQVSTRTRILVLFDWLKTKVFGRDVTRM
jgi:NADH dehydrogenase FAD-containing subunit